MPGLQGRREEYADELIQHEGAGEQADPPVACRDAGIATPAEPKAPSSDLRAIGSAPAGDLSF